MGHVVAVDLADGAIAAVAIGAVVVHRAVAVLLSTVVLRAALHDAVRGRVVVDGFVLHQAQALVGRVVPRGPAVVADEEPTVVAAVDGLVEGRVDTERVAVGVDVAADVADAPRAGHRVALTLVQLHPADVDHVGCGRVDVDVAGERAVHLDGGAAGAQLPRRAGSIGRCGTGPGDHRRCRRSRAYLWAGLLADCFKLMRLVDAAAGRPVRQLGERGVGRQGVGAAVDAAAPEGGEHRVAGCVARCR